MSVIALPKAYKPLLSPDERYRYYIYKGGRGGAKSESFARALLLLGSKEECTILCAREFQNSIKESVHGLMEDIITSDEVLSQFYKVLQTEIRGRNGTQIIFSGLRNKIMSLKSIHNVKYCWVEEAETVSDYSWKILIPSIRAEGSEIWISFNPELEDSATNQRFVVNPPKNSYVKHVNYDENPYFPDVLRQEMEDLKEKNHQEYLHVWEGHCKQAIEGAVFSQQLEEAKKGNRIGEFPYIEGVPVNTYWDLGRSDLTAIWFIQQVGFNYFAIDYYQNNGEDFSHYAKIVKDKPYVYGRHYLPHDATHQNLAAIESVETQAKRLLGSIGISQKLGHNKIDGINAARTIMTRTHFDSERCADGLSCLRRFHYKLNEETGQISNVPVHDIYSHGSDGFMEFAITTSPPKEKKQTKTKPQGGWQGKMNGRR